MRRPFLFSIAGPSGSGKTTVAHALWTALKADRAETLSMDSYYRDLSHLSREEQDRSSFDVPEALDFPLLLEHIGEFRKGRAIDVPVYDFASHTRAANTRRLFPCEILIIEGLLALHWPALRECCNLRVFVNASKETCLARRIARDVRERGRTVVSVVRQYEATVWPMAQTYVLPSRQYADVVVGGECPLSESVEQILAVASLSGLRGDSE